MPAKKVSATTIDNTDAPTLDAPTPTLDAPTPTLDAPASTPVEQLLSYRDAVKLVAGVLRGNPDSSVVVEVIRDIVSGTGLDVSYGTQEEDEEV